MIGSFLIVDKHGRRPILMWGMVVRNTTQNISFAMIPFHTN
jgi:hypothetical protein